KVLRRLRRWSDDGLIARDIQDDGFSTITVLAQVNIQVNSPVITPAQTVVGEAKSRRLASIDFTLHHLVAAILFGLAIVVAYFGLRINAWYGASLARDAEAAGLLSGLSIAGDAVALLVPTAAAIVVGRIYKVAAWALWVITLAIALMAAIGFAAVNIADTTASRAGTANERSSIEAQLSRLTPEPATIRETRSVAAIDAELALAQGAAVAVWSATVGCSEVTRTKSASLCAPIHELRKARAEASRASEIEAALAAGRAQLIALPAIVSADPQAEMAAGLLRWASAGIVNADSSDIAMARVVGMTLLPQISGLVLMLAAGLWRQRH